MKTNQKEKLSLCSPELQSQKEKSTETSTKQKRSKIKASTSASFKYSAVSLVFIILGYQICLFTTSSAVHWLQISSSQAASAPEQTPDPESALTPAQTSSDSREHVGTRKNTDGRIGAVRGYESFPFNPNTASKEDFERLGFTPAQAAALLGYREKGGRWHRKEDFAKSYVVSEQTYQRLCPFICIPLLDINLADSAAFDALPGIGPYFASKMVQYRKELGGYARKEQLMDIYHFDQTRYDALQDLIECGSFFDGKKIVPLDIWTADVQSLAGHPLIRSYALAKGIVLYREHHSAQECTVSGLLQAGVISETCAEKLRRAGY